jgi:hypothetical protein
MRRHVVTMIVETEFSSDPEGWDWIDLTGHRVSHVMSRRIYPFPVSSHDRERYDIPHVDEIQQEFEESEREYEMRDEVYPDDVGEV